MRSWLVGQLVNPTFFSLHIYYSDTKSVGFTQSHVWLVLDLGLLICEFGCPKKNGKVKKKKKKKKESLK